MKTLVVLLALAVPALAQGLEPLSFLVGDFAGTGKHPWGPYQETFKGELTLGGTALTVRTRSTIQGRTVFEDVRVFTYDKKTKRIRMRQFAMGDVIVYDVAVDGDTIVCTETAHEGGALPPWRYTFVRKGAGAFTYRVDAEKDGKFSEYVSGSLRRAALTAGAGEHQTKMFRAAVSRAEGGAMPAEIHHPVGAGPFPVIVMSPGGGAQSTRGYGQFGRRWASWGFVVAIVAFRDEDAVARASKFGEVAAWLTEKNSADGFQLKGQLDLKRLVAAGHSRGGAAAILASHKDQRFSACVAIAPAGPQGTPPGDNKPRTLIVIGTSDQFHAGCVKLYDALKTPRVMVSIDGMDHMCGPPAAGRTMIARSTAFLDWRVGGNDRSEPALLAAAEGVKVQASD